MADYNFPLYAGWAPPTCLVSFDLAGGTSPEGDPFADQTVIKNAQAHQPDAEPLREGYSFVGWALAGEPFSFASPIREDITLQAL